MGLFDDLFVQKRQEQQAALNATADHAQQAEELVRGQLTEEKQQYDRIAAADGEAPLAYDQEDKKKLAPPIQEAGMNKKTREKVRNRTLANLKKGREEVGELATSQTIPLMRSMKKNMKVIAKQREKERIDIAMLADTVIPADLFDVDLTEEHSHFDVKKALVIKDKLDRIWEYKQEHTREYATLDHVTRVKLEYLIAMKEGYERTLRTVLAANGLSETGEKLEEDEIRRAREDYYPMKEAFRETVEHENEEQARANTEMKDKLRRDFLVGGELQNRKTAIRDDIVNRWASFQATHPDWIDIPHSYRTSDYFSRVIYRMVDGDDEASYQRMRQSIDAFLLTQNGVLSDQERDARFEILRQQITPEYIEYRKQLPRFVRELQGKNVEELIEMAPEILRFELSAQHVSDIVRKSKNSKGKTVFGLMDISESEQESINTNLSILTMIRKRIVCATTLRAAQAGVPISQDELMNNMKTLVRPCFTGQTLTQRPAMIAALQGEYDKISKAMPVAIAPHTEIARKSAEPRISRLREIEAKGRMIEEERISDMQAKSFFIGTMTMPPREYMLSFEVAKETVEDIKPLWDAFKASGFKTKNSTAKASDKTFVDFKQLIRELFGGLGGELEKEDLEGDITMLKIDEMDATMTDVMDMLQNPTEDSIMHFLQPLLDIDVEHYLSQFDRETLEDPAATMEMAGKILAEVHPMLALKQFSEEFIRKETMGNVLSDEAHKKIVDACYRLNMVQAIVAVIPHPANFSPTEFLEVDLPGIKCLLECVQRTDEMKAVRAQAVAEFTQEHPVVVHKLTDISAMQIDSLNGMMGLKVINGDNVSLPFSEEEMGKTLSLDADFVRSTAERLKGFSLVDENGRSRVLFSSDAKELVSFGKEDLIYYTEMARDANLLLLANLKDSAKLSEILGEDTQKILKDCRRIGAISHALEYKLQGPDRQLSMLRQMYYEDCKEVPETLEILREEQRIAAAEQKEKAFLSDRV